eukprot:TRINITY_DN29640_c0_g1_i1.p1 TRINITY_DN29640_c0_g1~~TRINITY_DN29640_c0_g1_i1.p1  ORF type:complete len:493 (+),score=69.76 TRINITY_DN29640_c0_g1_i1:75-1481(+)
MASHLVGLRAAMAVGAHLSTYRGGWSVPVRRVRHRALNMVLAHWPLQLLPISCAALMERVENAPGVPIEARRAFRLFAQDLGDVSSVLSLWARLITRYAVETHVQSHAVLQEDLERHPALASSLLRPPVFIVGLPRTGTTFLHHLLALDPDSQCLRAFELLRPVRSMDGLLPTWIVDFADWARLSVCMRAADVVAPQWPAHHTLDAASPEECLFALQRSMPFDTHYRANTRLPEVYAEDHAIPMAAYERYRLFLKQVQVRRGSEEKHYVLKGQLLHLQYMAQLKTVFPDARVVWAHRPAEQVVGSLCSLRRSQQEVFLSEPPSLQQVGQGVLSYLSNALQRASRELGMYSKDDAMPLVHVEYKSLVADPVFVVEEIYKSWGWEVSSAHREAMEQYLERSIQERSKGADRREEYHRASLDRYGLTTESVAEHFERLDHGARAFAGIGAAFRGSCGVLKHSDFLRHQAAI